MTCAPVIVPIGLFSAQLAGSGGTYFLGFYSKVCMYVHTCYTFLCKNQPQFTLYRVLRTYRVFLGLMVRLVFNRFYLYILFTGKCFLELVLFFSIIPFKLLTTVEEKDV